MEIKYEAVFGPQELFDNEFEPNAIAVIFIDRTNKLHATSEAEIDRQLQRTGSYIVAMRRIIRTPTWTVADQKAGKLPEVGSKFLFRGEELCCHYVDGNGEIWANNIKGEVVTPWLREITPIESPEEKAARLRDEWVEKAVGATPVYEIASHGYSTRLKIDISSIYDAMISGDLPVPAKEK